MTVGPLRIEWSERKDSNLRPSGPKPDALPDCATLRQASYSNAGSGEILSLDEKVLQKSEIHPRLNDRLHWVGCQAPRVMGISTSPGSSKCLANSSLAKELR